MITSKIIMTKIPFQKIKVIVILTKTYLKWFLKIKIILNLKNKITNVCKVSNYRVILNKNIL